MVGVAAVAGAFLLARASERTTSRAGPQGPYLVGAWTFGDTASFERALDAGALDEVSLDWLQSRPDGSVVAPRFDGAFLERVRESGVAVCVTLTDYDQTLGTFDGSIPQAILATAASRRRHAEAVAEWCRAHDVDGLDLDWEALRRDQRARFTAFVRQLARRLHEDGRFLAVDVVPKTYEPGGWSTPQAQDWKDLGRIADQVRVMTYNYSGSWSGPGPLSPPGWMDAVLDFAETQIPPQKIVMGLGFYGRDWRGAQTTDLVWADVRESATRARPEDLPRADRGAHPHLRGGRPRAHRLLPGREGDRRQGAHDAPRAPAHRRRVRLDAGPGAAVGVAGARRAAALSDGRGLS